MAAEPYATIETAEEGGDPDGAPPWWNVRVYLDHNGPAFCEARVRGVDREDARRRFREWAVEVITTGSVSTMWVEPGVGNPAGKAPADWSEQR